MRPEIAVLLAAMLLAGPAGGVLHQTTEGIRVSFQAFVWPPGGPCSSAGLKPLPDAEIHVSGVLRGRTDVNGTLVLYLPEGNYSIEAKLAGYSTSRSPLAVAANRSAVQIHCLRPELPSPSPTGFPSPFPAPLRAAVTEATSSPFPAPLRAAVTAEEAGPRCTPGFQEQYQCVGEARQRLYQQSDCRRVWKEVDPRSRECGSRGSQRDTRVEVFLKPARKGQRAPLEARLGGLELPYAPLEGRTLEFFVDGVRVGRSTTLTDGRATLDYTPSAAGSLTVEVLFRGDILYLPGSGRGKLAVAPETTSAGAKKDETRLTLENRATVAGQEVQLEAKLEKATFPTYPLSHKLIEFRVNDLPAGSASTAPIGVAQRAYTPRLGGNFRLDARFPGDNLFAESSATATLTVAGPTGRELPSSGLPGGAGGVPRGPATTPVSWACTPYERRCRENSLQECSEDGQRWNPREQCAGACDPEALRCTVHRDAEAARTTWWRIFPSVELTSTQTRIPVGGEALLTLSLINPSVNVPDLEGDAILKLPSGVTVESTTFVAGGSNQMLGQFSVKPGGENHITIRIRSQETGVKLVESQILYYPSGHKEAFNAIQNIHKLTFEPQGSASSQVEGAPAGGTRGPGPRGFYLEGERASKGRLSEVPGFEAPLALACLAALLFAVRRWRR